MRTIGKLFPTFPACTKFHAQTLGQRDRSA
jgi:hypothetical protein